MLIERLVLLMFDALQPQKKRCSVSSAKSAHDSGCETSVDTLTDTTDLRAHSKRRKAKRVRTGMQHLCTQLTLSLLGRAACESVSVPAQTVVESA